MGFIRSSYDCPECSEAAFIVMQYPRTLECLCCGCQWQLVRPAVEDLDGDRRASHLQRLGRKIAAGRSRMNIVRSLASGLSKDHPAEARAAEGLLDLLANSVRILESVQRLQAQKPTDGEVVH